MAISDFLFVQREIPGIDPQFVAEFFGTPIASSTMTVTLITLATLVFGIWFKRRIAIQPGTTQIVTEMAADGLSDLTQQITGSNKHFHRMLPVITAIFVYLVVANLITYIPGITSFTVDGTPVFGSPTADFNTTFGLALGAVIALQIVSLQTFGVVGHIKKYIPIHNVIAGFKKGIGAGFTSLIDIFVGILDIIGEFAKVISLSLRLFGNMLAGNILATVLLGAFAFGIPSIWLGFNLLVGVLQALVFAALVGGYYMLAIDGEPEEPSTA